MEHYQMGAFRSLVLKGGRKRFTIKHHLKGRDIAMVMLDWVGEQLLPMFNPPWIEMTSTTYDDFVALALCNQKLHKIGH
jgi:hypothetical protein